MATRRKLVIDCDPGNDDAMSILMALSDVNIDVIAITCVAGNCDVTQASLNALRVLQVAKKLDIPVYTGCDAPLLGERKPGSPYHGVDGLGDVPDPGAPGIDRIQIEHGVQALLQLSKEHAGELQLVSIGPLTNVAMAIRLDSAFGSRLKSCHIMGGNYQGRGNITMAAEFNFYADPEAAFVVLGQLCCPMTVMPWETCLEHAISWETHTNTRSHDTEKARFIKSVDEWSVNYVKPKNAPNFVPADEACMACFLSDDVIKSSVHVYATVETKGHYTSGQMVVDWRKRDVNDPLYKKPNVTIVTGLHQSLYEQLMDRALSC
ncbi:IUNH-like protein [Mya arenaria]|uniref:IUNH-like protein n=1 Tax=Mya arenaria TaxID=6604 RepID=A0ABY7GJA9_MYAAR|nr:IUNH-like protein [Mya arenaria]WAR31436.1 IUNH-like protein [Mya arenaria]